MPPYRIHCLGSTPTQRASDKAAQLIQVDPDHISLLNIEQNKSVIESNDRASQEDDGEIMLFFVSLFLLLLLVFFILFKFATADADFTLMSKRHVKHHEIEDKVVWITGASRGIGEVLAKQLAHLGAKLILSSRNEADLERVKGQLTGKHVPDGVEILPFDMASSEDCLRIAVEKAETFFHNAGVDYMIHNAAFERPKITALDVTEESLKVTFNVNVLGTITLTRLLAPYMLKRGKGRFVVMSSTAGKTPAPGQAIYSASKYALNGYFHTLRSELYQKGIGVTVVCPGPIDTPSSGKKATSERRLSTERCAELTIIAATHSLKEVWISSQPVLAVMYLVQYMPTIGYWLLDKIGGNRVEAAARKGDTYALSLLFKKKKAP